MTIDPITSSEREQRFNDVVAAYLEAVEAGQPEDRDRLLGRHPDLAQELAAFFAAQDAMGRLAAPLRLAGAPHGPPAPAPFPVPGLLGDYRVLREVGRGGMGVVYEAEQVSLNRRVALKVLPFAATLDPRQLQRFRNEAQAAAHLQHQHIVPVYAVGCERGVHYYAMQFVDGQTLANVIAELRRNNPSRMTNDERTTNDEARRPGGMASREATPADETAAGVRPSTLGVLSALGIRHSSFFRTVAHLGLQAAEALEHAHQLGVVHRDVKPANLMVDGRGHLWVTDFGLAHVPGDTRLTLTGDLVGTLRYMSPEQALAKRAVLDHRTDVYSLGVTLYELLTLEPALNGRDRQELLAQIAFEDPKPPRRLNRAIPAELETIILKAIAKNPDERYVTAQELADDLGRHLKDEPIRARRPTLVQRARKWARRHRAVVATTALAVLAVVAVLAGNLGWVLWDQAARRAKTGREVNRALQEAALLHGKAQAAKNDLDLWAAALSAARRAEGLLEGGEADKDLQQRVQTLLAELRREEQDRRMLARLAEIHLEQEDGDVDLKYARAFREYAIDVEHLEAREAAHRIRARGIAVELAAALDHWADMVRRSLPNEPAKWKHLLAVVRAADPDPGRDQLRQALGRRDREALIQWAASDSIVTLQPPTLDILANSLAHLDALDHAVAFLRKAQQQNPADLWVNYLLALCLARTQPPRWDEAVGFYRAALALRPDSARLLANLGAALHRTGAHEEAIAVLKKAIRLNAREPLALHNLAVALQASGDLDGAVAVRRQAIAGNPRHVDAHDSLGKTLWDKGDLDGAVAAWRQAIALDPKHAPALNNLAAPLQAKGDLDGAIATLRQAISVKPSYVEAHFNLGNVLWDNGDLDGAIAAWRQAVALDPKHALALSNLGGALKTKGDLDGAVAACLQAIAIDPKLVRAHNNLGLALQAKGHLDGAIAAWRQAVALDPKYPLALTSLGAALTTKGDLDGAITACRQAIAIDPKRALAHNNLGGALRAKGDLDEAIAAYQKAVAIDPRFANAHYNLGLALRAKGDLDGAIAAWRQAIQVHPEHAEAHINLGSAQRWRGELAASLASFKEAEKWLPQTDKNWPALQLWIRQGERLLELDGKLPAVLRGEEKPANVTEQLNYAQVCSYKRLFHASARFAAAAFAADPKRADDLGAGYRFAAARAAALTSAGQGADAAQLDEQERARWRRQALDWLRADLTQLIKQLESPTPPARAAVQQALQKWQRDPDLTSLRDPAALAKLAEAEREAWQQLWADVEKTIAKTRDTTPPGE